MAAKNSFSPVPSASECPATLTVVDPATRVMQIPSDSVFPTQATARPIDRNPSLCMLFIQGRCRQGSHCHQVHADPDVVRRLREAAAARPTCCQRHGDDRTCAPLSETAPEVHSITFDGLGTFPIELIATTQGAHKMLTELDDGETNLEVTRSSVCRLQILGRCRYAEDCNFIHVCRELTDRDQNAWGADRKRGSQLRLRRDEQQGRSLSDYPSSPALPATLSRSSATPVPPITSVAGPAIRRGSSFSSTVAGTPVVAAASPPGPAFGAQEGQSLSRPNTPQLTQQNSCDETFPRDILPQSMGLPQTLHNTLPHSHAHAPCLQSRVGGAPLVHAMPRLVPTESANHSQPSHFHQGDWRRQCVSSTSCPRAAALKAQARVNSHSHSQTVAHMPRRAVSQSPPLTFSSPRKSCADGSWAHDPYATPTASLAAPPTQLAHC